MRPHGRRAALAAPELLARGPPVALAFLALRTRSFWRPYAGARAGCFAGRGLKRGGVIFLYPSSGLSAAAQYRLPRPRRRIVPVSLPPAGAGHVRNDPRRRGLESGNESRSPWRKPGELAALSTRFAPICFPTPRCTRRPHPLTSPAAWSLFLDFLDSPRGRARVGSSSLPGPALVLVREKGRLSRTRR